MEIKHNSYFNWQVQSVAIVRDGITVMSTGTVLPGRYAFGKVARKETIKVTFGVLNINGKSCGIGGYAVVEAGEEITISADEPAAYSCEYG